MAGFYLFVFFAAGTTASTSLNQPMKSPLRYLEATTDGRHATHHHFHDDYHRKSFCSCGKCSLLSQFQHSCPLAFSESQSPVSRMSHCYTFAGNLQRSVDDLPMNSALSPEPSPELLPITTLLQDPPTCDRETAMRQCFRSRGVQPRTFYLKDYCIGLTFQANENASVKVFDTYKETLELRCLLESVCPLVCNHFTTQPHRPSQVMVKMKQYLTLQSARNKRGNMDPRDAANFAMFLLLLGGDIELNPGPTGNNIKIKIRIIIVFVTRVNFC